MHPLFRKGARLEAETGRLFAQAAGMAGFGAWECELARERLSWTESVYDLFGFRRGSEPDRAAAVQLYEEASRTEMLRLRARALATGAGFAMDAEIATVAGKRRWMRLSARPVHENGRPVRLFGLKRDITFEKRLWAELPGQVPGTAAPAALDTAGFRRMLDAVLAAARVDGQDFGLVLVDIDDLAGINAAYGRAAGDACLKRVSDRLGQLFAGALAIVRLGEDEFGVLLPLPHASALGALAGRACRALSAPLAWHGQAIALTASLGAVPVAAGRHDDSTRLLAAADSALRMAKAAGGNRAQTHGGRLSPAPGREALMGLRASLM